MPWAINGMSWTTYRNRPDAVPGRGARGHRQADPRDRVADGQLRLGPDGLGLGLGRPHAARAVELRRARPPRLREEPRDRDRREGAQTSTRSSTTRSARSSRAREPDDLVLFISRPRVPVGHAHDPHGPPAEEFGFLEFSASNVVFGPMQWGPVRKVARKVYDMLGLHGKVSLPQSVNWSKTKAFTTIRSTGEGVSINLAGREPDGIVDPADFEKVRDQVMDALVELRRPEDRPQAREGDLPARGDLQGQARRHRARHPDGAGRAVLAHPREVRDRGRRLDQRRPPASRA